MNRHLFFILLLLLPAAVFSQEYIRVNTQYNAAEKFNELTIEIVNKSDGKLMIPNYKSGGELHCYFELYFYDKDGQQVPVFYYPTDLGVPFCNSPVIPKFFEIEPHASYTFKYATENLFHYCKEPDRIKKMKLKFHIRYSVSKNDSLVKKGVYEQFSKIIKL